MTKQELLKLSQKAKKDFDLIANRGLEQIRHQLSFFYLSDLTLSKEQNDEVTSCIKKHLQDDAEANEETLYRRYLLQAEFIYQQYSSHESKPTKETMNDENNSLAELSLQELKQKYETNKQKLEKVDLSDEGRAKLGLVQQEFDERQALFNKVFLRGDKPEWTLDEHIERMKTAVSLADILDYGATASVFTKIDLEVNNWIPETVGGMRAGGMNDLAGYLKESANDPLKHTDPIRALFNDNLDRYGEITGMPGTLAKQIELTEEFEMDAVEQFKRLLENAVEIERKISSKGHKMQDTLNALNKKMNSMSQRNDLTSALSKALVLAKALTSRVMGFLFNEPSQKRELERVVDLVADTFDKYKGRSDIPASRIIELKQKLQNLKEKMQDDTYPYSARLENKITVLSYEMEEVINQKLKQEKRKESQSNPTPDLVASHAFLTPANTLQRSRTSHSNSSQNSTTSALPLQNQTKANPRSSKK